MKFFVLLFVFVSTCFANEIVVYRIESPKTINIASFSCELKASVLSAEKVICFLPKTSDDVFKKTLMLGDTSEIANVLVYLIHAVKQGDATKREIFDAEVDAELRKSTKYFGSSVSFRLIEVFDARALTSAGQHSEPVVPIVAKKPIIEKDSFSAGDAFLSAFLGMVIIVMFTMFMIYAIRIYQKRNRQATLEIPHPDEGYEPLIIENPFKPDNIGYSDEFLKKIYSFYERDRAVSSILVRLFTSPKQLLSRQHDSS